MKTLLLVFIKFTTFKYLMYEEGNRYEKFFKKTNINSNFICYVNLLSTHHNPGTIPDAVR